MAFSKRGTVAFLNPFKSTTVLLPIKSEMLFYSLDPSKLKYAADKLAWQKMWYCTILGSNSGIEMHRRMLHFCIESSFSIHLNPSRFVGFSPPLSSSCEILPYATLNFKRSEFVSQNTPNTSLMYAIFQSKPFFFWFLLFLSPLAIPYSYYSHNCASENPR